VFSRSVAPAGSARHKEASNNHIGKMTFTFCLSPGSTLNANQAALPSCGFLKGSPPNAERPSHRIVRLDQALGSGPADGVLDERRAAAELELLAHVEAVGLDGFHAHVQPLADLASRQSLAEQLKDFKLPVRQLAEGGQVGARAA